MGISGEGVASTMTRMITTLIFLMAFQYSSSFPRMSKDGPLGMEELDMLHAEAVRLGQEAGKDNLWFDSVDAKTLDQLITQMNEMNRWFAKVVKYWDDFTSGGDGSKVLQENGQGIEKANTEAEAEDSADGAAAEGAPADEAAADGAPADGADGKDGEAAGEPGEDGKDAAAGGDAAAEGEGDAAGDGKDADAGADGKEGDAAAEGGDAAAEEGKEGDAGAEGGEGKEGDGGKAARRRRRF